MVSREVLKGVHVIEVYAHTVLVVDDKVLLFDASKEADAKATLAYLPRAGIQPRDLQRILVTHTHPDHVGGLATLKGEAPDARVAAHEADADFVSKARPSYPHPPLHGKASPWQGVPVDDRLRDGQRYEGLRVVHCPGHTPGSIAFLDEERSLLIAGDTLCTDPESTGDPGLLQQFGVAPMNDAFNSDPGQHRAGIKKLAALDFESLVVGHGDPVLQGAGAAVKKLAERL